MTEIICVNCQGKGRTFSICFLSWRKCEVCSGTGLTKIARDAADQIKAVMVKCGVTTKEMIDTLKVLGSLLLFCAYIWSHIGQTCYLAYDNNIYKTNLTKQECSCPANS